LGRNKNYQSCTKDWNYELYLNYYDDAGQHKANIPRIGKIETGKKIGPTHLILVGAPTMVARGKMINIH
jgi:hypothetical protein